MAHIQISMSIFQQKNEFHTNILTDDFLVNIEVFFIIVLNYKSTFYILYLQIYCLAKIIEIMFTYVKILL